MIAAQNSSVKNAPGAFGTVWKAVHREAKFPLAMKILSIGMPKADEKESKGEGKQEKKPELGEVLSDQQALSSNEKANKDLAREEKFMDLSILHKDQKVKISLGPAPNSWRE